MDMCFILAEQYNFQLIGMTKNSSNPLGAKNNDSRPRMGASAILKSVDFRAFILFCTSHSSGIGSSADNLHSLCSDRTRVRCRL